MLQYHTVDNLMTPAPNDCMAQTVNVRSYDEREIVEHIWKAGYTSSFMFQRCGERNDEAMTIRLSCFPKKSMESSEIKSNLYGLVQFLKRIIRDYGFQ